MITEAQKRATAKYKANTYRKITIEIPVEEFESLENHLRITGEKRATFLRRIIKENIE